MRVMVALLALTLVGCGDDSGGDFGRPDLSVVDQAHDLASSTSCDPVAQTGCGPAAPKCTIAEEGTDQMPMNARECVAQAGAVARDQPCTRSKFGEDDCAPGLDCTVRGAADGDLVCRKLCHTDGDCGAGQRCSGLGADTPEDGLCVPACTPFGTGCDSGLTCATFYQGIGATQQDPKLILSCRSYGSVPAGGDCSQSDTSCAPDTLCFGQTEPVCVALCDDAHACASPDDGGLADGGPACQALPGVSWGLCD